MSPSLLWSCAGFAFVGRQVLLDVGGQEFPIDLLFDHPAALLCKDRAWVMGKFKPEHLGQLGFYLHGGGPAGQDRAGQAHHRPACCARARTRPWPNMPW
jgi:hypothetical protein